MLTRSQTPKYDVNIDFDEASLAWKANKKRMGNGTYVYTCDHVCKNGNTCRQERIKNTLLCKRHIQK